MGLLIFFSSQKLEELNYSPRSRNLFVEQQKEHNKALSKAVPVQKAIKFLLPHERELLDKGELKNITHKGRRSVLC